MIKLSFKENSKGKFIFKIIQNGTLFFQKEYDVNKKIVGDPFYDNQKDAIKDFVDYLQKLVNQKLKDDPNFQWKTLEGFKHFAGGPTQYAFLAEKAKEAEAE